MLVQQAAESRGTGGLPGGFVILETANGRMRVTKQGSNFELPVGEVRPPAGLSPEFIEHYGNLGAFSELWLNTNVSPDLTSVGKVIAGRWKAKTGQSLDGVVALDASALADVLRGSGEIALPGGRSLAPDQLVDYLAIGQYRDYAPPTGTPASTAARTARSCSGSSPSGRPRGWSAAGATPPRWSSVSGPPSSPVTCA